MSRCEPMSANKAIIGNEINPKEGAVNAIAQIVSNLFDNSEDSDFRFKFNDKYIFVHKLILKMRCEHFRTMFSENWDQIESNELEITQYSYSTYYAFIKFIYTNVIDVKPEDIFDLYDLANSYFE